MSSEINFEELAELVEYVAGEGTYTVLYANDQDQDDRVTFTDFEAWEEAKRDDFDQESTFEVAELVQAQGDAIQEAIDKHDADVIRAAVKHMDGSGLPSFDPTRMERYLTNNFRGEYESAGAYARSYAEDTAQESKQEFLTEFGNFINWEEYASSAFDDDFVRLTDDEGNEYGNVYVFDNDPRV